jgi:hypothetical protein
VTVRVVVVQGVGRRGPDHSLRKRYKKQKANAGRWGECKRSSSTEKVYLGAKNGSSLSYPQGSGALENNAEEGSLLRARRDSELVAGRIF